VLAVDLPGIPEENVDVNLDEQVLTITARREEEANKGDEKDGKYLIRERNYGSFTRRFTLPTDLEPENISAHYENGVLAVTVPRKPKAQACRIPITAK
jgi:HSP20 family protein